MIEKLPNTLTWKADPAINALRTPGLPEIAAKLNEVIEAVNQIQQFLNWGHPQQPPFPPVLSPDELRRR